MLYREDKRYQQYLTNRKNYPYKELGRERRSCCVLNDLASKRRRSIETPLKIVVMNCGVSLTGSIKNSEIGVSGRNRKSHSCKQARFDTNTIKQGLKLKKGWSANNV